MTAWADEPVRDAHVEVSAVVRDPATEWGPATPVPEHKNRRRKSQAAPCLLLVGVLAVGLVGCAQAASSSPSPSAGLSPSAAAAATRLVDTASPSPVETANPSPVDTARPSPAAIALVPIDGAEPQGVSVGSLVSTPTGAALLGTVVRDDGSQSPVLLSGSADGKSWQRLTAGSFGAPFGAMAAGPIGWVAAGLGRDTVLWFSRDGIAWEPAANQGSIAGALSGNNTSEVITAGQAGFAIAGSASVAGSPVPGVWISRDGRTWSEAVALHGRAFAPVIVTAAGFVALALDSGTAYFSSDGISWRDLSTDPGAPFGAAAGPALAVPVASTLVVARVGASGAAEVFRGSLANGAGGSGIAWQHASATDAAFAGAGLSAAANSNGALLVLGYDRTTVAPLAWTSADGVSWRRIALDPATFGGGVPSMVAGGGAPGVSSFVAVGARINATGDLRSQVWRSGDGTDWTSAGGDVLGVLPASATGPCPATVPSTVEGLRAVASSLWPACFGGADLKVRGIVSDCGGCGGATNMQATPAWLIDPLGISAYTLGTLVGPGSRGYETIGLAINPAHPVAMPPLGTSVEVTGHFDDPAAAACRIFPDEGALGPVSPAAWTVAGCRRVFVVTAIRILPA